MPPDHTSSPRGSDDVKDNEDYRPETTRVNTSESQPTASLWKQLKFRSWSRLGIDQGNAITIFKTSLAPLIGIALLQSHTFVHHFQTNSYLVALIAGLPRPKFFETWLLIVAFVCTSWCLVLLSTWCSIKARDHTLTPGMSRAEYNSSAEAVSAIFLLFYIYVLYSLRSKFAATLHFPCILSGVYLVATIPSVAGEPTMSAAIQTINIISEAFLSGFAISMAVSFLIFPESSRKDYLQGLNGNFAAMSKLLKTEFAYFETFKNVDIDASHLNAGPRLVRSRTHADMLSHRAYADELGKAREAYFASAASRHATLTYAQREFAWSKLDAADLADLDSLMLKMQAPLAGIATVVNILGTMPDVDGSMPDDADKDEQRFFIEWHSVMTVMHSHFENITLAMCQAIEHITLTLQLKKPTKTKSADPEAPMTGASPGQRAFVPAFDRITNEFHKGREEAVRVWCLSRGIELPADLVDPPVHWTSSKSGAECHQDRYHLFLILYIENLLWLTSRHLYTILVFAESKVADGTLRRNRLIKPEYHHIRKCFTAAIHEPRRSEHDLANSRSESELHLGQAYQHVREPEHLPPANRVERLGNHLRRVPKALKSDHSVAGLRAACAVMSVAITFFLKSSQEFVLRERFLWALFAIVLTMSRTAGSAVFNFIGRFLCTLMSMVFSYIIWYIVDQQVAGAIVLQWAYFLFLGFLTVKYPRFTGWWVVATVASIVMIGNELEYRSIGYANVRALRQAVYAPYVLFPLRLGIVSIGLVAGLFWTIFPYPLSEHSQLRKEVSSTLFVLANYHAVMTQTVRARIDCTEGDPKNIHAPGHHLARARSSLFDRLQILNQRAKMNMQFINWQLIVGGRFPKATYARLIQLNSRIGTYITLIDYASGAFSQASAFSSLGAPSYSDANGEKSAESKWLHDFRSALSSVELNSQELTHRLVSLYSALAGAHALSPYLKPLQAFHQVHSLDSEVLRFTHFLEPGYAAFASIQVALRFLVRDVNEVQELIKSLVGELDFSFVIDEGESQASGLTGFSGDMDNRHEYKRD